MISPSVPSNSVTLPATPRWSAALIAAPSSSKRVGARAMRVSSSPMPSSRSSAACCGRTSASMSTCASSATNEPSSSFASGLISARVSPYCMKMRASGAAKRISAFRSPPGGFSCATSSLARNSENGSTRREMALGDVLGVLLGDFLDVDPAHVGQDHHGALGDPVPGDAEVVLLRDRLAALDQHAARAVSVDLEREDLLRRRRRRGGRVGEQDAARLHAPARQDLALEHDRPADRLGDRARVGAALRQLRALRQGDPVAREELLRFVLVEAQGSGGPFYSTGAKGAIQTGR